MRNTRIFPPMFCALIPLLFLLLFAASPLLSPAYAADAETPPAATPASVETAPPASPAALDGTLPPADSDATDSPTLSDEGLNDTSVPAPPAPTSTSAIQLRLNDTPVVTDVAPIIIDDRTLVPARAVFESAGGTVLWDDSDTPAKVFITYADTTVVLYINSDIALVNDQEVPLDVPAQILNDRTLIPVRFVAESLSFTVRWDALNRAVDIYYGDYPVPPLIVEISQFDIVSSTQGTRVVVQGNADITNVTQGSLIDPPRFYLDVSSSALTGTTGALEWQREISVVRGIEVSPLPENVTRILFELSENAIPLVTFSPEKTEIYLDFPRPLLSFDPWTDGKLSVMLDPGHGAETPGKRSPDNSLLEYEFNRDMAGRIRYHLERHGVEVLTTTADDGDLPLADRCLAANTSDADIFVSLHANAFGQGWTSTRGWEIYVYRKGSYSEQLALSIQRATIPDSGLTDRGLKAERFYVIRNTNMPAVLIEHGFYTNRDELQLLLAPDFREKLAVMDAKGILNFLGVPWIE
jgi:N-acetylmuramoyl-L-alanine amidase